MKLSHLSLAILSAIALAACGGSGSDDHTTDPNANKPGATDQTPKQPEDKKDEDKKEDTAKEDAKIVDPTGDQVVDNISLAKDPTTASQQYIRGKKSKFDRIANPSEPASATVLSGITLDLQNPQLTNIVIARVDDKNSKGEKVQIALYAGSPNNKMESITKVNPGDSLQVENKPNVLIGGTKVSADLNSQLGYRNSASSSTINGDLRTINANLLMGANSNPVVKKLYTDFIKQYEYTAKSYIAYKKYNSKYIEAVNDAIAYNKGKKVALQKPLQEFIDKKFTKKEWKDFSRAYKALGSANLPAYEQAYKDLVAGSDLEFETAPHSPKTIILVNDLTTNLNDNITSGEFLTDTESATPTATKVAIPDVITSLRKYGAGLAWITQDGSFSNTKNTGWGDYIDAKGQVVGVTATDGTHNGADEATSGLVGIYRNSNKLVVRGSEDNNVRTTRIFGHYYLDPGSVDGVTLNPEGYNSWAGADTFITGLNPVDNEPNQYGLGVEPLTLNHVQYGRVTAVINDITAAKHAATFGWVKEHQKFANRSPKHDTNADDFYFYRGTDATTIDEMSKLPTDTKIAYQGHALMYGIDNSFHGAGLELPNAFGNENSYGVGNFVKAELDMGKKQFEGYVYNAWGSPESSIPQEDKLVDFKGNVIGNTVIGTSNLAYDTSKTGSLRASFYGAGAEEVGGALNSVKGGDQPYGQGEWGGVFGAQKTSSGNSSWLVSSNKK